MIKRYEWDMEVIADMRTRSAEGWERDDQPTATKIRTTPDATGAVSETVEVACLMRREVAPGRVQREEVRGFQSRPTVPRNCWTCKHASAETEGCAVHMFEAEVRQWVRGTHEGETQCPTDADGCPGWTAKEAT